MTTEVAPLMTFEEATIISSTIKGRYGMFPVRGTLRQDLTHVCR